MTKREFLNKIIENKIDNDVVSFAQELIQKMDTRNEKRKSTLSKSQLVNQELKIQILDILKNTEGLITSDIAKQLDLSTQKVSALALQLQKEGKIQKLEVKIKGKGKRAFFKIVE